MTDFLYSLIFAQGLPGTREGVPYWILWFLLCIILLLITFIFLRDKNLRQRLNSFFFVAKRKLIKLRIQARLKKENTRLSELYKGLGQKTWEEGFEVEKAENFRSELERLEAQKHRLEKESEATQTRLFELEQTLSKHIEQYTSSINKQTEERQPYQDNLLQAKEKEKHRERAILEKQKELENSVKERHSLEQEIHKIRDTNELPSEEKTKMTQNLQEKVLSLNKRKEEADATIKSQVQEKSNLERLIKQQRKRIEGYDQRIKKIQDEGKKKTEDLQKEIKKWEQKKIEIQENIENTNKKKAPLFEHLGKIANKSRIQKNELEAFYSQIDMINKRIEELEQQIENL